MKAKGDGKQNKYNNIEASIAQSVTTTEVVD